MWLRGKESACQCREPESHPWVGKTPWRRAWQPHPYSCRRTRRTEVRGVTAGHDSRHALSGHCFPVFCEPFSKLLRLRRRQGAGRTQEHRPAFTPGSAGAAARRGWVRVWRLSHLPREPASAVSWTVGRSLAVRRERRGCLVQGKKFTGLGCRCTRKVFRRHRSSAWAVTLRWAFPDNGAGFLQRVPRLGGGGRSPTSSPCESAASAMTGPPPGFAEPGESHLRTSSAYRRYHRKFGPPRDAAHLWKKSSHVIINSTLKGIRTLNGLHERPLWAQSLR